MNTMLKNDSLSTFVCTKNYPKFEGMTLVAPYSGSGWSVTVPPNDSRVICVKINLSESDID